MARACHAGSTWGDTHTVRVRKTARGASAPVAIRALLLDGPSDQTLPIVRAWGAQPTPRYIQFTTVEPVDPDMINPTGQGRVEGMELYPVVPIPFERYTTSASAPAPSSVADCSFRTEGLRLRLADSDRLPTETGDIVQLYRTSTSCPVNRSLYRHRIASVDSLGHS